MLGDADLDRALQNDEDIYVIHMADADHKLRLNRKQKATLKKWRFEKTVG
jgi:hypothetical protein